MSKNLKLTLVLLAVVALLILVPFVLAPGAEFGGSDDAGSQMVEQVTGQPYEPWFTPVLETRPRRGTARGRSKASSSVSRRESAWGSFPSPSAIWWPGRSIKRMMRPPP